MCLGRLEDQLIVERGHKILEFREPKFDKVIIKQYLILQVKRDLSHGNGSARR